MLCKNSTKFSSRISSISGENPNYDITYRTGTYKILQKREDPQDKKKQEEEKKKQEEEDKKKQEEDKKNKDDKKKKTSAFPSNRWFYFLKQL